MQTQYYCYGCSINTTDFPVIKVYVTDFPVVNVHVDELSSARNWQQKLCATLSASVNIITVFQSNYTTVFELLDISESK
jgi:hypothetical protein